MLEGPMQCDITLIRDLGTAVATHDVPALFHMLFKVGSPRFLLKRIGLVMPGYVKESGMVSEEIGPAHFRATLTGRALPYYFCTYGMPAWFEAALQLSGARTVTTTHATCAHRGAPACSWDVRWT
jgi:hypothetical protein